MRESIFQGEWMKSWRHHYPKSHVWKIPDMPRSAEARFIPSKPYDCFALLQSAFCAMELKLVTGIKSFPFDRITDWQMKNLLEVHENGGVPMIVINYRAQAIPERVQKKFLIEKSYLNTVLVFHPVTFNELDTQLEKKSATFGELVNYCDVQIFKEGKFWNVPKIFSTHCWDGVLDE